MARRDNAAQLVRERMASDGRIRLVQHDANRGLSAARNTGLSHARGAYVWIPDPDDRYDRTLLARVHAVLTDTAADAVVFGCTEEYFDAKGNLTGSRSIVPPVSGVASGDVLHRSVLDLEEATLYGYAWNKVYRRSELSGLAFETVPLIEDILFNIAFSKTPAFARFWTMLPIDTPNGLTPTSPISLCPSTTRSTGAASRPFLTSSARGGSITKRCAAAWGRSTVALS